MCNVQSLENTEKDKRRKHITFNPFTPKLPFILLVFFPLPFSKILLIKMKSYGDLYFATFFFFLTAIYYDHFLMSLIKRQHPPLRGGVKFHGRVDC